MKNTHAGTHTQNPPARLTNQLQRDAVCAAQIRVLLFSKGLDLSCEGEEASGTGGWLFTLESMIVPQRCGAGATRSAGASPSRLFVNLQLGPAEWAVWK